MGRQKQAGFAIVEAALIVVVLGLLVGVGVFVVSKNGKNEIANQTGTSSQTKKAELQAPSAQINTELEKTAEVEIEAIDDSTSEIDKNVDSAIDSDSNVGDSFNENEL